MGRLREGGRAATGCKEIGAMIVGLGGVGDIGVRGNEVWRKGCLDNPRATLPARRA